MALEGIGTSIASELAKDLLYTLKHEAQYCFCFNSIVEDFETEKRKLVSKQEVVLKRANDAKNQTEHVTDEVEKWLLEAKECIDEAEKIEEETKIKGKCFLGWGPNCICQYRLGRKMSKKTQKLAKLCANSEFSLFSCLDTLQGIGYYCSEDFIHFKSREFAHDQLLEALRDDQNFRIGLYGMGGLGKTTLVKEVGKEVEKSKPFDKVIFVVVSDTPHVRKIQDNIASSLGLGFKEEHESNRAQRLFLRLTNGEKILIILDDVWGKLDFKAIGIPFDNNQQGFCRVLLTTRSALVCRSMNCRPEINLSLLSNEDAWILFKKHASIDDQSSKNLQDVAQEIAMECKGLPVAIAAVASTLKGRPPHVWSAALNTLKNSYPMIDIDEGLIEIYKCLRLSYDNLEIERAKGLFLLCSMFPEDYEIPMEDLTRFAISLGLFGEADSYETLRIRVQEAKNKLIDSCLLLNVSDKQQCVRMHDLVREVAHVIANKEIQVVIEPKKDLKALLEDKMIKDATRFLWFHTENMDKTPDQLGCPKLKILVAMLEHFSKKETSLMEDAFFGEIECLRVLTLIKLPRLNMMPLQIPELISLKTLRLNNWKLGDISVIGRLKSLETLELEGCSINELPAGILELNKLRLLGLFYCEVEANPYEVLGRLSQLEEMYFTRSSYAFLHWKVDNKNISKYFNNENWHLTRLKRYCIEIGDVRLPNVSMNNLKSRGLSIEFFYASTSNAVINDLVQRAEILHLKKVQGGYKSINPGLVQAIGGMTELIKLSLYSCSDIECLADSTKHSSQVETIFSRLVNLKLKDMDNFTELCRGPPPLEFVQKIEKLKLDRCKKLHSLLFVRNLNLHNLKFVKVTNCPTLTSLFTLSVAHSLELLEELRVERCEGLKCIFEDQRERESEDNIIQETKMDAYQKISYDSMLPKFKNVDINSCDSLECIFPLSFASGLKQLETIDVERVPELKHIFGPYQHEDQHLQHNVREIKLSSLREINFFHIPSFISIFDIDYNSSYSSLQGLYSKDQYRQPERTNLESTSKELHTSKYKNSEQYSLGATAKCLSRQLLNLCLLREITLSAIPTFVSLFTLSTAQEMRLEYLAILDCHGLKHIITTEEDDHAHKNNDTVTIFPKLRSLVVENCNLLEIILPISLAHGLVQLEYIEVNEAPQLEYIFGHDDHLSHEDETDIYVELPSLKELDLRKLTKTMSICPKKYHLTWPLLKDLILMECPHLRTSFIINCIKKEESREIIKDGNVSRIEVQAVEDMLKIESLVVENDGELEGIFQVERQPINSSPQTPLSSRLQYLNLKDLPELRFICMCPVVLSFQNLSELYVKRCGKLSYVFSVNVSRSLPQLRFLTVEDCNQVEQIVEDKEDQLMFNHYNSHIVYFPMLFQIIIRRCNKLRYLFAFYASNDLPQLHKLVIEEASELEEVFGDKMNKNEGREKTVLPSLCDLKLKKLPRLVSIYYGFKLQNVEYQDVEDCPKYHDRGKEAKQEEKGNKGKEVVTVGRGIASQMTTNQGEKEEEIEVHMEMSRTTTQIKDDNFVSAETSNTIHQARSNTALTNPNEGRDTAPQITTEGPSDVVSVTPSRLCPPSSSKALPSSVSLPPTAHAPPPEVDPSVEEYANFRDIGSIKKKHIPLLEEAIAKYPSLWTWRDRFKRSHMKQSGYISLGDMLEFLAPTKWKDLTEEKNAEFESLVDELEAYKFDIQWLQKTRSMIEQRKLDDETINLMKTLEVQVIEQEIEVQKAKEKLEKTKLELDAIRAKVGKFDDFIGF